MGGGRNEDKVGKGEEGFVNNRQIWVNMRAGICLYLRSLPVWECGLKLNENGNIMELSPSLPVRECGLKYTT